MSTYAVQSDRKEKDKGRQKICVQTTWHEAKNEKAPHGGNRAGL